jgi:uncharacterized protein YoxC
MKKAIYEFLKRLLYIVLLVPISMVFLIIVAIYYLFNQSDKLDSLDDVFDKITDYIYNLLKLTNKIYEKSNL